MLGNALGLTKTNRLRLLWHVDTAPIGLQRWFIFSCARQTVTNAYGGFHPGLEGRDFFIV